VQSTRAAVAMQSARSSSDTQVREYTPNPDHIMTINQLTALVREQGQQLQGFRQHMSQVQQSVVDVQHQLLWCEYLQSSNALSRRQQQSLEYAQQNYGIMPFYRGPAATEIFPQHHHHQQQVQMQQPASVVAHYHIAAATLNEEQAPVSSIPNPPSPTPAPAPQQIEFCYAPRILNAQEVEQGKYHQFMPTVVYEEHNNDTAAVPAPQAAQQAVASPAPILITDEFDLNQLLEISPEIAQLANWSPYTSQENYRQN
jgi:hypothetical protein